MDRATVIAAVYACAYMSERDRIYRSGWFLNPDDATKHDVADRAHAHGIKVSEEASAAMERSEKKAHEESDASAP